MDKTNGLIQFHSTERLRLPPRSRITIGFDLQIKDGDRFFAGPYYTRKPIRIKILFLQMKSTLLYLKFYPPENTFMGMVLRFSFCVVETTYSGRSDNSLKNVPQTRLVQSNGADYSPLWGIDHLRSKTRFQLASGYPQGSL